jgi:hypothetical protein
MRFELTWVEDLNFEGSLGGSLEEVFTWWNLDG